MLIRFAPSASPSGRRTNSPPHVGEGSHPIDYFYNWPARRSLGVVWRRGWDVLIRFAPSASPSGRRTNSPPHVGEGSHPIDHFYNWPARRSLGVVWRRGWDSNPRLLSGEPLFESGAFNHSATSPGFRL